jgi:predicted DNA-binding antitoxin AbrB/MazE fold protein
MSETVDAIYGGGVFKPLVPLQLPEGARVTLTVGTAPISGSASVGTFEPRDDWERRLQSAAIDCGVSLPDTALASDALYDS